MKCLGLILALFFVLSFTSAEIFTEDVPTTVRRARAFSGGRNCYFSPINCIIPRDVDSLYKKYQRLGIYE